MAAAPKPKTAYRFTATVSDPILYIAYENKDYDLPALEVQLHESLRTETKKNINKYQQKRGNK